MECSSCYDELCNFRLPHVPLRDILTEQEQIDILQEKLAKAETFIPSFVLADIRKDLNALQGRLLYFEDQLNRYMAPQKRKKLQKSTDGKEQGVTPV